MDEKTYVSFYVKRGIVRVFTKAVREIGSPQYIRFLIDPVNLQMVMVSYDKKEMTSFKVPRKMFIDSKDISMRVCSKTFCFLVAGRMGWSTEKSYRVPGVIYVNQKLVKYDLSKATEIKS